jgi:Na+/melibiose symporter-like transporter
MATATPQRGFHTLFKNRNFLLLWLAQLLSMTVLNASNYAIIVLIEEITGSTTLIALAIICFSIPAVIIGAPAGVFVDHRNKRRVLFYSNILRAFATFGFVISLVINRNELVTVFLLTFLISSIGQFFTPAEGASIPLLVDEDELTSALSLFNITFMLSQAIGFIVFAPIILSLLPSFNLGSIPIFPAEVLYAIIAVLYLVSALLISMIPSKAFTERKHERGEQTGTDAIGALQSVWNEVREGWTFIRRNSQLFLAVIQLSFAGVLLLVIGELATPLVTRLFNLPASPGLVIVFAPAGVGLVAGSIVMPRILQRMSKEHAIFIGNLVLAGTIVLLPLSTFLAHYMEKQGLSSRLIYFGAVPLFMFIAGVAIDFINIPAQTAIQEFTPEWIKGRVLALQLILYNAFSIPILLFIGGFDDAFGIDKVIYLVSVIIVVFGLWGRYYERRHKDQDTKGDVQEEKAKLSEPESVKR